MRLSEVTTQSAAEYLRLVYSELSTAEQSEIQAMVTAAVDFIKGYAGLEDVAVTDELIGVGDGETLNFYLSRQPSADQTIYLDGVAQTVDDDYTINDDTGLVAFDAAPAESVEVSADYTAVPSDAFEDLPIAAYVLISDMYDNRAYVVDKSNVNRVVDSIVGLHATNLL